MDKKKMASMFGIETYEDDNNRLTEQCNRLAKELEFQKEVNRELASDFIKLQEEYDELKRDPDVYIEEMLEKYKLDYEAQHKDDMEHKWYQIGRMDVFRHYGCKILEAKEQGHDVEVYNGKPIEIFTDLVDVKPDADILPTTDEIFIDDLVGVV